MRPTEAGTSTVVSLPWGGPGTPPSDTCCARGVRAVRLVRHAGGVRNVNPAWAHMPLAFFSAQDLCNNSGNKTFPTTTDFSTLFAKRNHSNLTRTGQSQETNAETSSPQPPHRQPPSHTEAAVTHRHSVKPQTPVGGYGLFAAGTLRNTECGEHNRTEIPVPT